MSNLPDEFRKAGIEPQGKKPRKDHRGAVLVALLVIFAALIAYIMVTQ